MQSRWRVACVRIPRFPIGAVWRNATDAEKSSTQLSLGLQAPTALPQQSPLTTPRFHTNDAAPKPLEDGSKAQPKKKPFWDEEPIVLVEGQRGGGDVRAATAAAGRSRIRVGMTLTEAKARCAALIARPWDDTVIAREITRTTAAFVAASPQVTPVSGAPGLWWIGVTGLGALGGEPELARTLWHIARQWHPQPRVAIAGSCVAARAATWQAGAARWMITPIDDESEYLAQVPLGLIPMDGDMREALYALGLRTAGALAGLEADDVERRWGEFGLRAWRLAHGDDPRRPVLAQMEAPRSVVTELNPSVTSTEPLLFLLRSALERLVREGIADGRSIATVALTLTLDDAHGKSAINPRPHTVTREVRLPKPLARVEPLLERCRLLLEKWVLTAPVCGLTVAIAATAPLSGDQGDLLDTSWRDPAAAEAAFARLRAELGLGAIVQPALGDSHRPEEEGKWDEASLEVEVPVDAAQEPSVVGLAHRQLESAEPAQVECDQERPRSLRWRSRVWRIHHAVGPERLAGDWWRDPYARDYWRCEEDGGATLVVYRRSDGEWFVQGWAN
jgi:protein ImuB